MPSNTQFCGNFSGAPAATFFQHVHGVALAVEVPGDIQRNQVDITYFWVFRSERAHFSQQIRKDDTHLLVL
ncbi:hypothetical protein PPS11_11766, partial [Pseudomonas putida S11]